MKNEPTSMELSTNNIVNGFDNNPNVFISFINNPISIVVVSRKEDDSYHYPRAFATAPDGTLFGGFALTTEGLTEKENEQFSKVLNETGINNKTFVEIKDENDNVCKVINLRKAIMVATLKIDSYSYNILKAQWELTITGVIELGDFKSDDHQILNAGTYMLTFNDELSRNRAATQFISHYEESYKIAKNLANVAIKEG